MQLSELSTAPSGATVLVVVLVYLLVVAALYVWVAVALSRLFVKLGEPSWKGWVPVVNELTVFTLGGFSPLWVISLFFPIVQLAGLVVFCFSIHAINQKFGNGPGYTVLGILLFPVWASILGFGNAQPLGARAADAAGLPAPTPFESRMAGLAQGAFPPMEPSAAYAAPAPDPVIYRPVAQSAPVPPMPPAPPVPPVPPVPVAPPVLSAEPAVLAPITAEPVDHAAVAPDAWAPPISSIPGFDLSVPPPAVPPVATPSQTDVVTPLPRVEPSSAAQGSARPETESDNDETVIKRRGPTWLLEITDGVTVALTSAQVLLGRNPTATGESAGAQLVPIADPSKTMSKTHAWLVLGADGWTITDLNSTNGTAVIGEAGQELELDSGVATAVTGRFLLGQFPLQLRRVG